MTTRPRRPPTPDLDHELVIGSLCTGYGGLDLGVLAAFGGGRVAWVADPEPHVRTILAARAPDVPNLGDIATVDWDDVEEVDIITAGFPCQDISAAGKGLGIRKGARSGIWRHVVHAVRRLRPALVVVENVAALRWRNGGIGAVLGDLADIGYDANWTSVRASDVGAPHRRERVFVLAFPHGTRFTTDHDTAADRGRRPAPAHPESDRQGHHPEVESELPPAAEPADPPPAADTTRNRRRQRITTSTRLQRRPDPVLDHSPTTYDTWGDYAPAILRWESTLNRTVPAPTEQGKHGRPMLAPRLVEWLMGLPEGWVTDLSLKRVAQLRALGNGVVPQQAAYAIHLILADLVTTDTANGDEVRAA